MARMVDVEVIGSTARFRIEGEGHNFEERGADFWSTLEDLKEAIPGHLRLWTGDEWAVELTETTFGAMTGIFSNADRVLDDTMIEPLDIWSPACED